MEQPTLFEREYELHDEASGEVAAITVRIGAPRSGVPTPWDWDCSAEIEGPDGIESKTIAGPDALGALLNVLIYLSYRLREREGQQRVKFYGLDTLNLPTNIA